jgi:RNA polymerase sigma-70 factor, ECF subfamily
VSTQDPAPPLDVTGDLGSGVMLAFQAGDETAFDRIVERHWSSVRRFIERSVADVDRAEDLTQEVFIRVYRSRDRYRPSAGFRTWLFTIANRLALNEARSRRRRSRVFRNAPGSGAESSEDASDDFWANIEDPRSESPLDRLERKELEMVMEDLLGRLSQGQRAAIELQRAGPFSYREIAEIMGVTVPAVKSLLVRAREALKEGVDIYLRGGRE